MNAIARWRWHAAARGTLRLAAHHQCAVQPAACPLVAARGTLRQPNWSASVPEMIDFASLDRKEAKKARSDWRKSKKTRFLADENLEPWALYVMRFKRFDVIDCDMAKLRHSEDRHVFRRAWQLKRILVTHDADFLNDRVFPLRECAGLLVLPTYGAVSMEFGNLLAAAAALISRGENLWLHTKIEATRGFVLKVRTWEKLQGRVVRWEFKIPKIA
jgi:predicted nuclease of predicted toxin-antitoxin system